MKRVTKASPKFDLIRLLDQYARRRNIDIANEQGQRGFIENLKEEFSRHRDNEILIHGLRIQSMFLYVVAALDHCRIVKEEDAGEIYTAIDNLQAPDYRIITREGKELLVEVKNFHSEDPKAKFNLKKKYRDSLSAYAALFSLDVYIAVYWSKLKIWTLVPLHRISNDNKNYYLSLVEAIKWNEMYLLGDKQIGTTPYIGLRLYPNSNKPQERQKDGTVKFSIGKAELFCGEDIVDDQKEQEILWMLINHGDWPVRQQPAEQGRQGIVSVSFVSEPEERSNPQENFELLGTLSTMISRQFNEITAPSGKVEKLSTARDPSSLDALIPHGYKGSKLPLWPLTIYPAEE